MRKRLLSVLAFAGVSWPAFASTATPLSIPQVAPSARRFIGLEDMARLRHVATLSVSPDGKLYAVLVYSGEGEADHYRSRWFVGKTEGGPLRPLADGGPLGPRIMYTGHAVGQVAGSPARWSPDGRWIAFTRRTEGALQLWRVRVSDGREEQLTRQDRDVRDFAWEADGDAIIYTASPPHTVLVERAAAKRARGYHYDSELWGFPDLLLPNLPVPPETDPLPWLVDILTGQERRGDDATMKRLRSALSSADSRVPAPAPIDAEAGGSAVARPGGGWAWVYRPQPRISPAAVVKVAMDAAGRDRRECTATACSGSLSSLWWRHDGNELVFHRAEGPNNSESGFYAFDPTRRRLRAIVRSGDDLKKCAMGEAERLVCVREGVVRPPEIAVIDLRARKIATLVEINPEFRNIRLGKVERIEWDTPRFPWSEPGQPLAGLYPSRAYGYILYPPDFDAKKSYPVFIDPYVAQGFDSLGNEHPLHVYAAQGLVVLRLANPMWMDRSKYGSAASWQQLYSPKLGFPHLSMLAQSTFAGLDRVIERGFVDLTRIGIGGVSHGSFIPLYMMQHSDRIAAISIASPNWGPLQYFWSTQKARSELDKVRPAEDEWLPDPDAPEGKWLREIDIADHIEQLEGPVLIQMTAHESFALSRFIRRMADAGHPYDAFLFADETHTKWQPAHLRNIQARNLDWFRFWLQDAEDSDPGKADQYLRWRGLRTAQCRNPRRPRGGFCVPNERR